MNYDATVVITTRNRRDVVEAAIRSTLEQQANVEIIVVDDASTDNTAALIKTHFPMVRLVQSTERKGLIVQRNMAAKLASAPIIFSLDDDAIFTSPTILPQVIEYFKNPKIGAVAVPIKNIIDNQEFPLGNYAPDDKQLYVTGAYLGGGHALRKSLFFELGGYQDCLFQWGEEAGFCQRLYDAGYLVALASTDFIHHFPHPAGRHKRAKNVWIYRNSVLNVWFNAPGVYLFYGLAFQTARWLLWGIKHPYALVVVLEGLMRGYYGIFKYWQKRLPVSEKAYRIFLMLQKRKVVPFHELEILQGQ